jgi:sec-independent protein translocase protein TatC
MKLPAFTQIKLDKMPPNTTDRIDPQTTHSRPAFPASAESVMPFVEHLEELRGRIISCVIVLAATTLVTFFFVTPIIRLLQALVPHSTNFVQLTPGEVFLSSFKLSFFAGIGLALPVILYHVFRFVSPGLAPKEKRLVLPLLLLGLCLFAFGVIFGYSVILPLMLDFLLGYGQQVAQNQLSIAAFLNFCTSFLFASGLVFQLPLVLLLMSFIGLINSKKLLHMWKWAIVASFVIGAAVTPSADPFSQTVMAASLFGLYGFSIGLIKLFKH